MSEYTWKILEDAHQALRTVVSGVSAALVLPLAVVWLSGARTFVSGRGGS